MRYTLVMSVLVPAGSCNSRYLVINPTDLSGQDIISYNKEQSTKQGKHNLVTVIKKQFHIDTQRAIDKAGEMFRERTEDFNTPYQELPRWVGPVDLEVQRLVDGFARCVTGTLHWSYENQRYFGTRGLEVKETRVVELLPQSDAVDSPFVPSQPPTQALEVQHQGFAPTESGSG